MPIENYKIKSSMFNELKDDKSIAYYNILTGSMVELMSKWKQWIYYLFHAIICTINA